MREHFSDVPSRSGFINERWQEYGGEKSDGVGGESDTIVKIPCRGRNGAVI
jgi:hypothetical protein